MWKIRKRIIYPYIAYNFIVTYDMTIRSDVETAEPILNFFKRVLEYF